VIPSETRLSRADNVHAAVEPGPVRSLEETRRRTMTPAGPRKGGPWCGQWGREGLDPTGPVFRSGQGVDW